LADQLELFRKQTAQRKHIAARPWHPTVEQLRRNIWAKRLERSVELPRPLRQHRPQSQLGNVRVASR